LPWLGAECETGEHCIASVWTVSNLRVKRVALVLDLSLTKKSASSPSRFNPEYP
jgi:hypothetical protein